MSVDDVLAHADYLSSELELDMRWVPAESGNKGYWQAPDGTKLIVIRARANRAIAFFDRHAGPHSQWAVGAKAVLQSSGENQSMESGARGVGELLRLWIDEVRRGFTSPALADEFGARAVASTDLMEQVQALLVDRKIHPAVPIVLTGAALEIALRSALDQLALPEPPERSLVSYAAALKSAGVLNKQDMKDVTQIAGVRNAAAHGSFDEVSLERARILEQQVNLFLAQLAPKLIASGNQ